MTGVAGSDAAAALAHAGGARDSVRGTVLGIDYGERRMGVAVGEMSLRIAHPLVTLRADSDRLRLQQLGAVMQEWKPVLVVVGLPVNMDGSVHSLAARCRKFAQRLSQRFGVEIRMVDERLSSYAAEQALAEAGVSARRRERALDQVAAQTILETFFATNDDAA